MPSSLSQIGKGIKSFFAQLQVSLAQHLTTSIETQLEAEVEMWLYRGYHQRRV